MFHVVLIQSLHILKIFTTKKNLHFLIGWARYLADAGPLYTLVKGKAIPLQAWTGPEDSRRLRVPYFKTVGT